MEISPKDLDDLRQMATRLIAKIEELAGEEAQIPREIKEMVAKKVAQRICLACDQPVPADSRYRRGLDDACYGTTRARIRRGEVLERDLIVAGKMTAENRKPPGRKAKMDTAAAADVASAEADIVRRRKRSE